MQAKLRQVRRNLWCCNFRVQLNDLNLIKLIWVSPLRVKSLKVARNWDMNCRNLLRNSKTVWLHQLLVSLAVNGCHSLCNLSLPNPTLNQIKESVTISIAKQSISISWTSVAPSGWLDLSFTCGHVAKVVNKRINRHHYQKQGSFRLSGETFKVKSPCHCRISQA